MPTWPHTFSSPVNCMHALRGRAKVRHMMAAQPLSTNSVHMHAKRVAGRQPNPHPLPACICAQSESQSGSPTVAHQLHARTHAHTHARTHAYRVAGKHRGQVHAHAQPQTTTPPAVQPAHATHSLPPPSCMTCSVGSTWPPPDPQPPPPSPTCSAVSAKCEGRPSLARASALVASAQGTLPMASVPPVLRRPLVSQNSTRPERSAAVRRRAGRSDSRDSDSDSGTKAASCLMRAMSSCRRGGGRGAG